MHYIYKDEYLKIFNYGKNALQMYGRLNMIIDFCTSKLEEYGFTYKISQNMAQYIRTDDDAISINSKTLQNIIEELICIQDAIITFKKNIELDMYKKLYTTIYHLNRLLSYSIRQYRYQLEDSFIEDI